MNKKETFDSSMVELFVGTGKIYNLEQDVSDRPNGKTENHETLLCITDQFQISGREKQIFEMQGFGNTLKTEQKYQMEENVMLGK